MDTVILKIHRPYKFRVANISYFLPELRKRSFEELTLTKKKSTRMYLRSFRFEPPFQDAYLPKIDVYEALNEERTEVIYTLQAAFSVPKLLFGNSVEEVSENDLERVVGDTDKRIDTWLEIAERGFNFAEKAPLAFTKASEKKLIEVKREIFSALGYNYTLTDGKLTISLDNLLVPIRKAADIIRDLPSGLEPPENQGDAKDIGEIYSENPCLLQYLDAFRTVDWREAVLQL